MLDAELRLERSALLLLDIQNGFLKPDSALVRAGLVPEMSREREELTANLRAVLTAMRRAGRPVFYINTGFRADKTDCYFAPLWRRCFAENPHLLVEGTESAAVPAEI